MFSNSGGKTSAAERIARKSAALSSRTSPALLVKGFLFIIPNLSVIRFAEADHPNAAFYRRKAHDIEPRIDKAGYHNASFGVWETYVILELRRFPVEFLHHGKRKATLSRILLAFRGIKFDFHG
jgi:hypothetical protein